MKTVWICVLLPLLAIVAYSGFSDALPGIPASPSIAAAPSSPSAPLGPIVLDSSGGRPAGRSMHGDVQLAANLSTYVFLHKTWHQSLSAATTARLSVCPE